MHRHICIHACACKFPDMLCIERFYSVIGSPLVASEGGRVVIQTAAGRGPGVAQAWVRRGPGVAQVCLNGLLSDSVRISPMSFACLCNSSIYLCLYIHACACKFPDMLCIEGFYTDIGSPLVAPEGGRVVVQTAAGRGPGVAQAWPRCASMVS